METDVLSLTPKSINYLSTTKKWALFLAILGFIGIAFLILVGIFMGVVLNMTDIPGAYPMDGSYIFSILPYAYIIIAVIYFIPVWYLFKFSRRLGEALEMNDQEILADSFRNLKNSLTSYGILIILGIVLYCIFLVVGFFTALGTMGGLAV